MNTRLVVGDSAPIQMKRTERLTMDPTQNVPGANPNDPQAEAKLRSIAKIVGVEPTDVQAILDAVAALTAIETPKPKEDDAVAARRLGLSSREVRMCRELKVSPEAYLQQKTKRSYKPRAAR